MEGLISLRLKMVIVLVMVKFGNGEIHYVGGGKNTWSPNINFSDWSSHQTFHLGDWLYFGFNKYQYNVLEVNQTSYENCIERDFIKNVTKGGRDVFQLTEPKTYYFLCGGGYCFGGMKLAVNVVDHDVEPPTPAPSPHGNNSSPAAASISHVITLLLLLIATSPVVYVDFLQYLS